MKHVILGTGAVGRAIMNELLTQDEHVLMINRSGQGTFPQEVEVIAADAYDANAIADLTKNADIVYQATQPSYTQWPEKFPVLQQSIIEGVSRNNAKLIIADNLYAYGEVEGLIHEQLPYKATTRKGKTRAAMAVDAIAAHKNEQLEVSIGRASDFFGPYVLGSIMGERAFKPILKGKPANIPGKPDLPHTLTFIEDFARALVILGQNENAFGQIWHVPSAPTTSMRQFLDIAFQQLGKASKITSTTKFTMRFAGLFIPEAKETVEMMYEFEKPFIVDHSKFASTFGDISTPHEKAIEKTLAWYKTLQD